MEYTNCKTMKVKKLRDNAVLPKRATDGSAGYDLFSASEAPVAIKPGERQKIPVGIAVELPRNTAGMIYTRSGLGIKYGIHVTNGVGVVDSDYRGEIHVSLHNLSDETYTVDPGERIAQLVVTPYITPEIIEADDLEDTERGEGGFGSTGRK